MDVMEYCNNYIMSAYANYMVSEMSACEMSSRLSSFLFQLPGNSQGAYAGELGLHTVAAVVPQNSPSRPLKRVTTVR